MKNAVMQARASSSGQTSQAVELAGDPATPLQPGDRDPASPEKPAAGKGLSGRSQGP